MKSSLPVISVLLLLPIALAAQTSGPSLHVSTANHQTIFHIGERIPLELSFTGPDNKNYAIDLASYDRSGRLSMDAFSLTPAMGWIDPLAPFFLYESGIGGGLRGGAGLSSKPIVVSANLNEWIRIDEPGTYHLLVTSHRVGHRRKDPSDYSFSFPGDSTPLQSNSLTLTIIPATPAWQETTLERVLRELAKPAKSDSEPDPSHRDAIADLRYLDFPAAITALAANLRDDRPDLTANAFFGIIAVAPSMRDSALASMNRLIDDPAFPISSSFMEALPWLQMDDPPLSESSPPDSISDEEIAPPLRLFHDFPAPSGDEIRRHRVAELALSEKAWQTIAMALPRKQGIARSITAQTLVAQPPAYPDPRVAAQVGAILRAGFSSLSRDEQASLLHNDWDMIASRELLPQLRAIATAPPSDASAFDGFYNLRAMALARWYEFDPDGATQEALHQIAVPNPTLSASDLYFLPDQPLPQFEHLWASGFANGSDISSYEPAASLLIHFGTGAVCAQMAALALHPGPTSEGNRPSEALAYLIRFDPATAKRLLTQSAHTDLACCTNSLSFIAHYVQDPMLIQAAIAALPSPKTAWDALQYLMEYGDSSARQPILDRYLIWADYWSSHPEELKAKGTTPERQEDLRLGHDLVAGLLGNQGWIPDAALKSTVLAHCTVQAVCDEVRRISTAGLDVTATDADHFYTIGPYTTTTHALFEAKIDQFPKGTTFTLTHMRTADQATQDKLEAALPDLFTAHGMKLVPSTP